MSQVDNLLDNLPEEELEAYTADPISEEHIVIDFDRFITVPESLQRIAVQFDHNVETVTFDCPRYWDGVDMLDKTIYINYMRPNGTPGMYLASEDENGNRLVTPDETDNKIMHFNWTISKYVTEFNGSLKFLVCINEVNETGAETFHWNTELNSQMRISEGLEVKDAVIETNNDIITQLLLRMGTFEDKASDAVEEIETLKNLATNEITSSTEEASERIEQLIRDIDNARGCFIFSIEDGGGADSIQQINVVSAGDNSSAFGKGKIKFKEGSETEYEMSVVVIKGYAEEDSEPENNIIEYKKDIYDNGDAGYDDDQTPEEDEYPTTAQYYLDNEQILSNHKIEFSTTGAHGEASHVEGYHTLATGKYSHAEGNNTFAAGDFSHTEGSDTIAHGMDSHAEGLKNTSKGQASHTEGIRNTAEGKGSHAEGLKNHTSPIALFSHAEGQFNNVHGSGSHAEGYNNLIEMNAKHSHVEGEENTVKRTNAHAEGYQNVADGASAHVEGIGNEVYAEGAHAEGDYNIIKSTASSAHAEGSTNTISAGAAHAEGRDNYVHGSASHAEGEANIVVGYTSHAEGCGNNVEGNMSHAEGGYNTITEATQYAHAEGNDNTVSANAAHAEGSGNKANGKQSHAEGSNNVITETAQYAHAEGNDNTVSANAAHAEGRGNKANGKQSHAEGNQTEANGQNSHSEGYYSRANGDGSHSEGQNTVALGYTSHAEGYSAKNAVTEEYVAYLVGRDGRMVYSPEKTAENHHGANDSGETVGNDFFTLAGGYASHAEGRSTAALGANTHSEGEITVAIGKNSHTEGYATVANGEYQHVQGRCNIIDNDNKYAHIVGNGTYVSESKVFNRSNAHTVDWDGNAWYQGNIRVGGGSYEDGDRVLTTEDFDTTVVMKSSLPSLYVDFLRPKTTYNIAKIVLGEQYEYFTSSGLFNATIPNDIEHEYIPTVLCSLGWTFAVTVDIECSDGGVLHSGTVVKFAGDVQSVYIPVVGTDLSAKFIRIGVVRSVTYDATISVDIPPDISPASPDLYGPPAGNPTIRTLAITMSPIIRPET